MGAVAANAKDGERAKAALKRWKCWYGDQTRTLCKYSR
jgi:hypothetical protein